MIGDDGLTTFGERLKLAMFQAGYRKNTDLARRIGVTEGTVRNWLTRLLAPSGKEDVIAKIAEVLNVSLSWLRFGMGPMQTSAQESHNEYAAEDGLTRAQRLVLRAIRADIAKLSDPALEIWYAHYQKAMDKPK